MFDISLVNSTYDDLANKVKTDLDAQYIKGRLTGSDYANVYATLMNTILQLSFQTPEKSKQIDLQDQQILNEQAQEKLIEAQTQVQLNQLNVQNQGIETQKAQEDLIKAQTTDQQEHTEVQKSQKALINQQTEVAKKQVKSFDQNVQLKLFKAQMDTWGVMFGSGMLDKKPSIITNDQVSSLYNQIKNSVN